MLSLNKNRESLKEKGLFIIYDLPQTRNVDRFGFENL